MIRNHPGVVEPVHTRHGMVRARTETASDKTFLVALFESVKGPEFALMPVARPIQLQLLNMQYQAMTTGYHAAFPAARFEVITLNEAPIGRLITLERQDRFHIIYIAVLPEWRNRGIASALLTAVLSEPRRRGLPCEATVAVHNLPSL